MIVITLTDCPISLRGDLSRWLQEINTGVYVGRVSARVREHLWDRIIQNVQNGRATMVFSSRNEQHMEFRVHNTHWKPIDFDGIMLVLRPHAEQTVQTEEPRPGFSKIARRQKAKKFGNPNQRYATIPSIYVVLDIETTGLLPIRDEIIEIGAILVNERLVEAEFHTLITQRSPLPQSISILTGITDDMIAKSGVPLSDAIEDLLAFIGDFPIVMHNASFDLSFLNTACKLLGRTFPTNRIYDTYSIAKKTIKDVKDYKLKSLLEYFEYEGEKKHRAFDDCLATKFIFEKVNEIQVFEIDKPDD